MATSFFTDEIRERFHDVRYKISDAKEELDSLLAEAENQQTMDQENGDECEVLDSFVEQLDTAADSLSNAEDALYWVDVEVDVEEEEN